jgi:hypothetical protein
MSDTTTDDIDDVEDEDLDDDADDAVDDVDEADDEPSALYERDGIESADDTGLIAGEELITNAQILQGINGKP